LQFLFELGAYEHGALMAALGHVGQQANFILNLPISGGDIASAQACRLDNPQARPVGEQHHISVSGCVFAGVDVP
jgi:hypothetical protein